MARRLKFRLPSVRMNTDCSCPLESILACAKLKMAFYDPQIDFQVCAKLPNAVASFDQIHRIHITYTVQTSHIIFSILGITLSRLVISLHPSKRGAETAPPDYLN